MDAYELVVSAIIIACAIWLSDYLLRAMLPTADYVDRESKAIRAIEERYS